MKTTRIFSILGSAALVFSCSLNEFEPEVSGLPVSSADKTVLYAKIDLTKTALQEDWSVFWEKDDSIAIVGETAAHSFKADAGGSSESTFTGTLDGDNALYAVYPEQSYVSRSGNKLTVKIPNLQYGLEGGFDRNAAVCVSKVTDNLMLMKHVVALVRFTLSGDDITSVSICNAGGVKIAGTVDVTIPDSGSPAVSTATSDHVLILPDPGRETFEAGTYYAAVAPSALSGGLQFMFTRSTDNDIASKVGVNPVSFEQGTIMNFGTVDSGLSWQETTRVFLDFATVDSDGTPIFSGGTFAWSNPFSYPDKFNSSYKSGTFKDQDAVLIAKEEYGGFKYPVHSVMGFVENSITCFRWGRGAGSYITIPQIPGLTLAAVRTLFSKDGVSNGEPYIGTVTGSLKGGDPYNILFRSNVNVIWHVLGTSPDEEYRIITATKDTGEKGECEMARLEFFYTGTPVQEKVIGLDCSASLKSSTAATLSADFCTLSYPLTYTCGFEYKKASESVWNSVDATPAMSFSYEYNGLEDDTVYDVRSWVNAGDGKVYSETKVLSTSLTKVTFDFTTSGAPFLFPDQAITTDATMKDSFVAPIILKGGENYCCALNYFRSGTRLYNDEYGVKWGPGEYLLFATSKDSYFASPAINGMTLAKVDFTFFSSNTTGSSNVGIYDSSNTAVSDLGVNKMDYDNPVFTLTPTTALKEGTSYRILLSKGESKKDRQCVMSISFYYSGIAAETVQYVSNPTFDAGTVSSKIYVNSVTAVSEISSGFEYKAGGSGSFKALASGGLSSMVDGVTTASASASLSAGDIVRCWASVDGGSTKVYSQEITL